MDLNALKTQTDIVVVVSKYIELRQKGRAHLGKCPFHDDQKASMAVYGQSGRFKCFACDAKGDVFDFVSRVENCDLMQAAEKIQNNPIVKRIEQPEGPAKEKASKTDAIFIAPASSAPKEIRHPVHGNPNEVYTYKNQAGQLLFYVCRFNKEDGSKEVCPYTPWLVNGRERWKWLGVPGTRPMYGLDRLRDGHTVAIGEGEKTSNAIHRLIPHLDSLTWSGGARAEHKTDFSPIYGRDVLIFPDCDQEGLEVAKRIYNHLKDKCPRVKLVKPEPIKKWDMADFKGESEQAILYARANVTEVMEWQLPAFEEKKTEAPSKPETPEATKPKEPTPPKLRVLNTSPYRALGFENVEHQVMYWFFSNRTQSILCYRSPALSKDDVIKEIAPANFWENQYAGRNGRINTQAIAERLREECAKAGFFNISKIRGRGAWIDENRVVIHTGNKIICDGQPFEISDFKTSYAYQAKQPIKIGRGEPLNPVESSKLIEIMELFNWERKISAKLLAGWCVIAPFCGVLLWRPHAWLIGGAATGKSWILQNVVRPILGDFHFAVQSKTTEAAIRQMSEGDALTLVFDEFEAENEMDAMRVQSIIELARSASSSDGGQIVKGSSKGKSSNYQERRCFCFASIAQTGLSQSSDLGRITTMALGASSPEEKEQNAKKVYEAITPEFGERLVLRTLKHMPVLLENIKTFSRAAAEILGDTRAGDQVGPMIAGAYLLRRSDKVTFEAAKAWVNEHEWKDERPRTENRDESRLLQAIIEKMVRCDAKTTVERTIGELIYIAYGESDSQITPDYAVEKLLRIGVNPKAEGVYFSTSAQEMKKNILRGTPWATNYGKILTRIDGATVVDGVKFSRGIVSRAILLPITTIKN